MFHVLEILEAHYLKGPLQRSERIERGTENRVVKFVGSTVVGYKVLWEWEEREPLASA